MGAQVAVEPRNPKLLARMSHFMEENYRFTRFVLPWVTDEYGDMPPPKVGSDLSAYAKPGYIGFYINGAASSHTGERDYLDSVIRWMALKVGKRTKGHVFFWYEDEKVLLRNTGPDSWNQERQQRLDHPLGYCRSHRVTPELLAQWEQEDAEWYMLDSLRNRMKAEPLIIAELERLNTLWEQSR